MMIGNVAYPLRNKEEAAIAALNDFNPQSRKRNRELQAVSGHDWGKFTISMLNRGTLHGALPPIWH